MWRRGADPEGYAANFVESEQILQSKGYTASYVQVSFFRHTNDFIISFILIYVLIVLVSWFCVVKINSLSTLKYLDKTICFVGTRFYAILVGADC
jgi:hypothetical protein